MIAFKFSGYLYLLLAVALGITSNGLLKTTNGFTNLLPTLVCIITIILCLFCLSKAMEMIPVGFAYATYGGLTITANNSNGFLIIALAIPTLCLWPPDNSSDLL